MNPKMKSLAKTSLPILRDYDELQALQVAKEGITPSCGSATPCNGCCKMLINITLSEAAVILLNASSLVRVRRARLEEQVHLIRAYSPKSLEITKESGTEPLIDLANFYWQQQIPCAFLEDDGRCGIYEYRPQACREYLVINDPADCYNPDPVQTVQLVSIHALEEMQQEIRKLFWAAENGGPKLSPMPIMLLGLLRYA